MWSSLWIFLFVMIVLFLFMHNVWSHLTNYWLNLCVLDFIWMEALKQTNIRIYRRTSLSSMRIEYIKLRATKSRCYFSFRLAIAMTNWGRDNEVRLYITYIVPVSFTGGGNRSTRKNPATWANHWQTLSYNVQSSVPRLRGIQTQSVSGDRHWLHR
jgi:hypothetical protein